MIIIFLETNDNELALHNHADTQASYQFHWREIDSGRNGISSRNTILAKTDHLTRMYTPPKVGDFLFRSIYNAERKEQKLEKDPYCW